MPRGQWVWAFLFSMSSDDFSHILEKTSSENSDASSGGCVWGAISLRSHNTHWQWSHHFNLGFPKYGYPVWRSDQCYLPFCVFKESLERADHLSLLTETCTFQHHHRFISFLPSLPPSFCLSLRSFLPSFLPLFLPVYFSLFLQVNFLLKTATHWRYIMMGSWTKRGKEILLLEKYAFPRDCLLFSPTWITQILPGIKYIFLNVRQSKPGVTWVIGKKACLSWLMFSFSNAI